MRRGLLVGIGLSCAGPAFAGLSDGLVAGTAGTAVRLVRSTLLDDPPPRGSRARERWVFRHTQTGPFDRLIADAADAEGIDPFLLKGLLANESGLNPKLVGKRRFAVVEGRRRVISGGARGIAQLTTAGVDAVNELRARRGAGAVFAPSDRMRPERAIPAAAALLADYVERFGRDGGITAYNTGPTGGKLVRDRGFRAAVRDHRLHRTGLVVHQGGRFLPHVLTRTNRLRAAAGLDPLAPIGAGDPPRRRPSS